MSYFTHSVLDVLYGEFLEWWMCDADVADVLFTNGVVNVWYGG